MHHLKTQLFCARIYPHYKITPVLVMPSCQCTSSIGEDGLVVLSSPGLGSHCILQLREPLNKDLGLQARKRTSMLADSPLINTILLNPGQY